MKLNIKRNYKQCSSASKHNLRHRRSKVFCEFHRSILYIPPMFMDFLLFSHSLLFESNREQENRKRQQQKTQEGRRKPFSNKNCTSLFGIEQKKFQQIVVFLRRLTECTQFVMFTLLSMRWMQQGSLGRFWILLEWRLGNLGKILKYFFKVHMKPSNHDS